MVVRNWATRVAMSESDGASPEVVGGKRVWQPAKSRENRSSRERKRFMGNLTRRDRVERRGFLGGHR
jgi:hypothetical protein